MKTLLKNIGLQKFNLFGTNRLVFDVMSGGESEPSTSENNIDAEALKTELAKTAEPANYNDPIDTEKVEEMELHLQKLQTRFDATDGTNGKAFLKRMIEILNILVLNIKSVEAETTQEEEVSPEIDDITDETAESAQQAAAPAEEIDSQTMSKKEIENMDFEIDLEPSEGEKLMGEVDIAIKEIKDATEEASEELTKSKKSVTDKSKLIDGYSKKIEEKFEKLDKIIYYLQPIHEAGEVVDDSAKDRLKVVETQRDVLYKAYVDVLHDHGLELNKIFDKKAKKPIIKATISEAEEMNVVIAEDNNHLKKSVGDWAIEVNDYLGDVDAEAESHSDRLGNLKKKKVRLQSVLDRVEVELSVNLEYEVTLPSGKKKGSVYAEEIQDKLNEIYDEEKEAIETATSYEDLLDNLKKNVIGSTKSEEPVTTEPVEAELTPETTEEDKKRTWKRLWIK